MVPSYAEEQLEHIKQKEDKMARVEPIKVQVEVTNQDIKTFRDYKPLEAYARFGDVPVAEGDERMMRLHQDLITIVKRLLTMWVDKVTGYGTSRYDKHDVEFDAWMSFSDIHRKTIRLEQLTRAVASGDESARDALLDAYADIALYCISNIQILEDR